MGKKNTKGTQKIIPIMNAGIESPPYETALAMSNTEEVKRIKQDKNTVLHSCKCKNKNTNNTRNPTRTWESITNLYGDADTTEVWNNREHEPNNFFNSKLNKHDNAKAVIDQSENNDVIIYPTSNLKNTPAKLSLFGLNRKRKKNHNKIKIGQHINEDIKDTDVKFALETDPTLEYLLSKKPKKVLRDPFATGDICMEGPCREALEKLYKLYGLKYIPNKKDKVTKSGHKDKSKKEKKKIKAAKENKIIKKSKNKQAKVIKTKKDGNIAYGDNFSPIPLTNEDSKDIQCKCSFIGKIMGHTNCKCKNNNRNTLQTPSNFNNEISKKEKTNIEIPTKENKLIMKSKNKQLRAIKAAKDGNVGNGDQISPMALNKKDLKDVQCKCSFIGKMMGHTNCKCKNDNRNTLQTSSNVNDDNSKTEKHKTKTLTEKNKVIKKSKNPQDKANKTKEDRHVGYGDQISPIPLKKQDLKDVQCKCSFIEKIMGHTNCKCKSDNGKTLQTSNNVNDDNSKTEKNKTKTPTKENKIIKKSKNKQAKLIKTKVDGNVGYGDQISPTPFTKPDLKDVQCKCSFIRKMMNHKICKCKNDNGNLLQTTSNIKNPTGNSLLEMKVDLTDMRVINSFELNENIRKLGRTERDKSCICPSHMKRSICEKGPCERVLANPHTRFKCKCPKQNIIECKDSTCDMKIHDIKIKSGQKKKPRSPVCNNKPLFEVMIEPTEMSVINAQEIKDIIGKASQNKTICPAGLCHKLSKQKKIQLNCKCVGKKMTPGVAECEERTCRYPEKRCKLSYLCSRVFSKSENWTGQKENRQKLSVRGNGYDKNIKRDDVFVRSHYKRNGVMINLPSGQTPRKGTYVGGKLSDVWCKCFCECNEKQPKKSPVKKKSNKKVPKRRRRRRGFFRKKKKDNRTCKEKVLDCLDKEQEECEKRVIRKTKEYNKNEKRAIKENKRIAAEQKEDYKTHHQNWNCITNFISGFLNVSFESVKTAFQVAFSVIFSPISSYIYVREKTKDPSAAIARIIEWFIRKWKNRSSLIARSIEDSVALNVIADQIESSAVYNALVSKGKTPAERMAYENRNRVRKRRMRKREDEALFGCRHMILTTMRKTPCLWFYHICPDLYPQCLSLTAALNNFLHVVLYCGAIMCWTPCIVACELCRGCMCCLLCTH